jgi:hypothetical protein
MKQYQRRQYRAQRFRGCGSECVFLKLPDRSSKCIMSPSSSEIKKEFYERPDVEFSVAEALLDRLLQNPNFQGDDDDRKHH